MGYKREAPGGMLTPIPVLPKGKLIKSGTYQGPVKTLSGVIHVADTWYQSVGTAHVASAGYLKRQTAEGTQYFRVGG